jgi:predicted SnoaL-like aldol condensation-catalyzing enzyme
MGDANAEKNKAIVLEAFDTLFNKRDYTAAERFWSPKYIQHSAHIAPGREGLFDLIKSIPATLKYEPGMIVAEGDIVIVHGRFFDLCPSGELDCCGHCSHQGRHSGRALGCNSG